MRERVWGWIPLVAGLALMLGVCAQTAEALVLKVSESDSYVEYLGVTDVLTLRNAPFRIVVPNNWNRTLLVYARGTGSTIMLNGDGSPIVVPIDPPFGFEISWLPKLGVTPLTNVPSYPTGDNKDTVELEVELLSRGYALAASDYKPDPRLLNPDGSLLSWVVEDGIHDTLAVTLQAKGILMLKHGALPNRTILWGRSQGSIIALKIIEDSPWLYDGVITGSTVGAGTPRTWDTAIGFALAFDVTFGWDEKNWGSVGGGNLPENLSFERDVAPTLNDLLSNPKKKSNWPLFEFIRLVNGLPKEGFYPFSEPSFGSFNWLYADMMFLTEVRADIEREAKADGRVGQNIDHVYSLTLEDKYYLNNLFDMFKLKIKAEDLLEEMNLQTNIEADKKARQYAIDFADFSGNIQRPVISMHTKIDGLVLPAHESALYETVADTGRSDLFVQVFTDGIGHCVFTQDQWLETIKAMESWLDTGVKPVFPNDFTPPAWPQPPQP
ncbi:MAG: hypothetical protein JW786_14975 [Desulfobacterales bacterium]|nr:hypothetical protein [Desulfobacterales bacterium]